MGRATIILILITSLLFPVYGEPEYEVGIGAIALTLPTYPGSEDQSFYLLPIPYFYYTNDYIRLNNEGLVGNIFESEHWELDASFFGGVPVDSDDSDAREGMPDLDWTFEAGPRLLYYFNGNERENGYFRAQAFFRKAFTSDLTYIDHIGHRAGFGLEFERPVSLSPNINMVWTNRLTLNWASSQFHNHFYGVSGANVTTNRPAFTSRSGYSSFEVSSGLAIQVDKVLVGAFVRYQNFSGSSAQESVLLETTSDITVGISAVWVLKSTSR